MERITDTVSLDVSKVSAVYINSQGYLCALLGEREIILTASRFPNTSEVNTIMEKIHNTTSGI